MSEVLEKIMIVEVEGFIVNDQQLEEVVFLFEEEGGGVGIKFVLEDDGYVLLVERIEKLLVELKEDEKGDDVDDFENQNLVLVDIDVLGGLIKEFLDINGLK